ncbi:MAG TPA: hypothetical protein ENJ54_00525 [Chloroflexi bacterium]|nr:hypothetical protein [Chloroflexota bacterium]
MAPLWKAATRRRTPKKNCRQKHFATTQVNYKTPENTAFFFAFFTLSAPMGYFPGAWHSKNTQASVTIDG